MTLELQHLCQRIQDEQGYLVIGSTVELSIGQVFGNANAYGQSQPLPPLVIVGTSTREEYEHQGVKYNPNFEVTLRNVYFYRMVAE